MSDCSSPEANVSINVVGDDENTFKILLATDCHLGYKQRANEQIQCNDSFDTFEEILQLAADEEVDFILLGGDLFHDSKPSQTVVLRCMNLLKTYCLGPNKIKFQFLTDPLEVLSGSDKLNYEDENLSISMPIFTIHGNHDNPSFDYTSTLDILVTSGFVNYFGKLTDLNELNVMPMVFKKGSTTIAIYGISYIGEQRLSRCFSQERVKFLVPEGLENAFNILVLHQNRARHTVHGHVPDDKLPSLFNLIFWGHEHECRIIPEQIFVEDGSYHVIQPGSSVATSLCEGESKPKHVGILRIKNKHFKLEPKKLQTVRPFVHKTLSAKEITENDFCMRNAEGICEYVEDYLNNTIFPDIERDMYSGHPKQPKLPLIRLKIMYHDDALKFDTMEITRKFCDRVANPRDIVLFRKEKSDKVNYDEDEDPAIALAQCFQHNDTEHIWSFTVQRGIEKYFQTSNDRLKMLSLLGLTEALNSTIDANDDDAFPNIISHQISKITEFLQDRQFELNEESFRAEIKKFHDARAAIPEKEVIAEVKRMLQASQTQPRAAAAAAAANNDDEDQEETPPTRGRGRGRGSRARAPRAPRGTRAGKTTARGRGSKNTLDISTTATSPPANESTQDSSRARFTQRSVQSTRAPTTQTQASQFAEPSDSDSN